MFVRETFTGDSKQKAELMIAEVKTAFKNNLPDLSWMDDQTRVAAIDKVLGVLLTLWAWALCLLEKHLPVTVNRKLG